VFAGVLVIGMLRNLLNLSNVQVFWQQVLVRVVIVAYGLRRPEAAHLGLSRGGKGAPGSGRRFTEEET
jgi:hypothetical protein